MCHFPLQYIAFVVRVFDNNNNSLYYETVWGTIYEFD